MRIIVTFAFGVVAVVAASVSAMAGEPEAGIAASTDSAETSRSSRQRDAAVPRGAGMITRSGDDDAKNTFFIQSFFGDFLHGFRVAHIGHALYITLRERGASSSGRLGGRPMVARRPLVPAVRASRAAGSVAGRPPGGPHDPDTHDVD